MPSSSFRVCRSATGLGLFATKLIKRSAYIATYRGRIVSAEEARQLEQRGAKYMFELNRKWVIDGSPRWNVARYINHSCWPNAKPVVGDGRITFVALRVISPGEEITYNYGPEYFDYFAQNGGCRCAGCRIRAAVRREKKAAARGRK